MSKIYYDRLLDLQPVEKAIKTVAKTHEEKLELWQVVDEIVHHQVMGCVLDHLPQKYHQEFLTKFCATPYDEQLLVYLKAKIKKDIGLIIKEAVTALVLELVGWYNGNYHGQRKVAGASQSVKRSN